MNLTTDIKPYFDTALEEFGTVNIIECTSWCRNQHFLHDFEWLVFIEFAAFCLVIKSGLHIFNEQIPEEIKESGIYRFCNGYLVTIAMFSLLAAIIYVRLYVK